MKDCSGSSFEACGFVLLAANVVEFPAVGHPVQPLCCREINDGLLAPRFAPSQKAWVLSGTLVSVSPSVPASQGEDTATDRRWLLSHEGVFPLKRSEPYVQDTRHRICGVLRYPRSSRLYPARNES